MPDLSVVYETDEELPDCQGPTCLPLLLAHPPAQPPPTSLSGGFPLKNQTSVCVF